MTDLFPVSHAVANICEHFSRFGAPAESDSLYMRTAYEKIYLLCKKEPRPTTEEVLQAFAEVQKVPLTYGDIRTLYG